jgi:hypothetical protein
MGDSGKDFVGKYINIDPADQCLTITLYVPGLIVIFVMLVSLSGSNGDQMLPY